jgi:hypothetical protein
MYSNCFGIELKLTFKILTLILFCGVVKLYLALFFGFPCMPITVSWFKEH